MRGECGDTMVHEHRAEQPPGLSRQLRTVDCEAQVANANRPSGNCRLDGRKKDDREGSHRRTRLQVLALLAVGQQHVRHLQEHAAGNHIVHDHVRRDCASP